MPVSHKFIPPGVRAHRNQENEMTIRVIVLAATLAFVSACATGGKPADDKPSGHEQTLIEMRAVVTAVDQQHRLLAIESDDGATAVLPVAEPFRDFDKLRVGDLVVVSYTRAIAWRVKAADQGALGVSRRETLSNPKPGEAPGGAMEQAFTITAMIAAVDVARGTITLTWPEGRSETLKVDKPANLTHVAVGDLVDITYSEVRGLAVITFKD
jgi:hypothetical protein